MLRHIDMTVYLITAFVCLPVIRFWDEGQPDNWDIRVDGEDCGQIHGIKRGQTHRHWNDADCSLNYRYICEALEKPKPL